MLFLLCCTKPAAAPRRLILHLDTSSLTQRQRDIVLAAEASWEVQTQGCVTIREGDGVRVVRMLEINDHPWWLVGLYTPEEHMIEVKFEYEDPLLVVTHEIGHVLGMRHVETKRSVMYKAPAVHTLSPEDRAELLLATGCSLSGV